MLSSLIYIYGVHVKRFSSWSDTKWQKKLKKKYVFTLMNFIFPNTVSHFRTYTPESILHTILTIDPYHPYHWSSASIKLVDPQDVSVGHSLPLSDCHCRIRNGSDGFQPGLDGEGCSSIWSVLVVGVLFLEVVGHIRRHVLPVDLDILFTIAPGLLVVEEVLVKLCKGMWILVD